MEYIFPHKFHIAGKRAAIFFMGLAWWLLLAGCAGAVGGNGFDEARAYSLIEEQVAMGPRHPGTVGHQAVGDWIVDTLEASSWQVEVQDFSYRGQDLRNIIGRMGSGGRSVLLGAHYDTRPLADRDAFAPSAPVPGANDGASGVAVLLELSRALSSSAGACEIRLVFFDAEDSGNIEGWDWAIGSKYYADTMTDIPDSVIIVDMVGDADLALCRERNSDPRLTNQLWRTARRLGHSAFLSQDGHAIIDDHIPFTALGIAAVDIIDIDYPYWHTTEDTVDKVSAESLNQVGETLLAWLQECR
jgi:glutaminyl-peptide cyclotransferase